MLIGTKRVDEYLISKLQELKQEFPHVQLQCSDDVKINEVEILITSSITKEELDKASNLTTIIFPYAGVNNPPLERIKEKNINLINTHAHAPIVALRAVTLGLALLGRVVELHKQLEKGIWRGFDATNNWIALLEKKVGMLGMGAIGLHIAKYLEPYNPHFVTLSRYKEKIVNNHEWTFYDSVEEVCLNADIVFISLPLTKDTKGIIDKNILSKMQDKYLVNVGRGELIVEADFYDALKNNTLKGAAIDVWYQYPTKNSVTPPSKYPFHELPNVILSPHVAGMSDFTNKLVADEIFDNLSYYITHKRYKYVVNLDKEY